MSGFPENFPLSNRLKEKSEIKVKFISGTIPFGGYIHINPAYWVLKSWYKRHGLHNDRIVWLDPIHYNHLLNENSIQQIVEEEKPDVICFSLYIWNHTLYSYLGNFIREHYPSTIMIAGGPEIYAHKDLDKFWREHSWLDAVAYGDGEQAFTQMLDSMIDSSLINTGYNISYRTDTNVLLPFKRFKDTDFNLVSPFIDNPVDVQFAINQMRSCINDEIIINWEFTKGCPYACSFCDWSSGLHHKVTRKQYDWRADIDFIASLNVSMRWVDANIGMFKDDIEVVKYATEVESRNSKFKFTFNNLAKLNKKATFALIDFVETARPGYKMHRISIQDTHADVLNNVDRPDVPWEEHKRYIVETKAKHPSMRFMMEMMLGLPGQTLEDFAESIIDIDSIGANGILGHIWCMLTNSPGYDKDYREKHKIRVVPAAHINDFPSDITTRRQIAERIYECEYYEAETVVGTYSSNLGDIMAINGMITVYNFMRTKMNKVDKNVLNQVIRNYSYWRKFGEEISKPLEQDLQDFGKMLFVIQKDGRPMSFGQFFNNQKTVADIIRTAYKIN